MQVVGEDPKRWIRQYSDEFKQNFLQLLRTTHGEKPIHINRFYQEYISDKAHVHLNATQWSGLTDFAKYLGREGICRVEEKEEDGIFIAWIDNSPEAIRRRERLQKGIREQEDGLMEQREIQKQVERAHQNAAASALPTTDPSEEQSELDKEQWSDFKVNIKSTTDKPQAFAVKTKNSTDSKITKKPNVFGMKQKQSASKKNVLTPGTQQKMSEIERTMLEDMERQKRRPR